MEDCGKQRGAPTVAPAPDRGAVAGGVLAMVLFSGNFACARHGLENGLSVADLVLIRYGVSGPLYLAVLLRIGLGAVTPGRAAALTLLGGAPYFLLTAGALAFTSGDARLHPQSRRHHGLRAAACLAGDRREARCGRSARRRHPRGRAADDRRRRPAGGGGGGGQVWIGDLLLLWSGFDWALYGVLMRRWRLSGLRTACVMGAGSLLWLPLHLLIFGVGGIPDAPGAAAIQAAYQGLIAGWLAIILYSRAVAALGPSRGALLPPLVPALGVFWAWLLARRTRLGLADRRHGDRRRRHAGGRAVAASLGRHHPAFVERHHPVHPRRELRIVGGDQRRDAAVAHGVEQLGEDPVGRWPRRDCRSVRRPGARAAGWRGRGRWRPAAARRRRAGRGDANSRPDRPKAASSSRARARASARDAPASKRASRTFSSAENSGRRWWNW